MNPGDRIFVIKQLRSGRERLESTVAGLTAVQWKFRPAEEEWL